MGCPLNCGYIQALDEAVRAFQRVPLSGCILTKVDEAAPAGQPTS